VQAFTDALTAVGHPAPRELGEELVEQRSIE
jgi:hypothetical protein